MKRAVVLAIAAVLLAAAAPAARAGELVVDGGFEAGAFGPAWVHGAFRGATDNPSYADHSVEPDLPYSGSHSALLGFKYVTQTTDAHAYLYQTVTIPAGASSATLNFKLRMQGYDSDFYDPFYVDIRSTANAVLRRVLTYAFSEWNNIYKDSGWLHDDNVLPVSHDVSAFVGQTVRLYFEQANLIDNLYETWTYVDDVSLVYRMWVDLAADGGGEDVFGALGSGGGGLSSRSALPGDTLSYDLRIENEGTSSDTYRLSATPPAGWSAWLEVGGQPQAFPYVLPALGAGASVTHRVRLVAPLGAAPGTYDLVVDAQSTAQGSRVDSARLRAVVGAATYATDMVIDGNGVGVIGDGGAGGFGLKTAAWSAPVSFTVELRNTGNAPTTYAVAFTGDPGLATSVVYNGTTYTGAFTTLSVPAGTGTPLTLQMQVPSPNPGGDYDVYLSATAAADANKRDSVHAILRLLAPRVDMIIAANGDNVYGASGSGNGGGSSNAGERSATVTFPITLQNEGAAADSMTLSWTAPGTGWSATIAIGGVNRTFPTVTPAIAPNAQAFYTLRIQIPANAAYGTYLSVLNAASRVAPQVTESVSATVSVATPSEVDILIDGQGADIYGPIGTGLGGTSLQTVSPGDTVVFQVQIQNVSGVNGFDVAWAGPAGWDVTFNGGSLPLTNIPAGTYPLRVVVPPSSLGGTFDVILDGRKNSKPFLLDSVTGRVVVTPPAIVDGLIDGNGHGVFGAVGSGAGGLSQQTTPTPSTMNFTLELQNHGPAGDSYRVQWNAIPAWTARLNGLPSPFVTGVVPAGGTRVYTFSVTVPAGETVAMYQYILDITSQNHPASFESITARVNVVGPPRPDLVIDGDGDGVLAPAGSGQGGTSTRGALPGSSYTSVLSLKNAGSFPDSFQVSWNVPGGWPAASIVIGDSTAMHVAPFWSPRLDPGQAVAYTVQVTVPASASAAHTALINAVASLPPSLSESVSLITQTRALLRGRVFDDRDHDQVFGPGDLGLAGVVVREARSGLAGTSAGDGTYAILVPADTLAAVEQNPAGFVSLSPDTVQTVVVAAGDTATVDFADVGALTLSAGGVTPAPAGGAADFGHRLQAGTAGQVSITATCDSAVTVVWYVDSNGNGLLDGPDRPLAPTDGDLDPAGAGSGILDLILRVFIPPAAVPGTTVAVSVAAAQTVTGTALVLEATASDAVVVTPGGAGQLAVTKSHDRADALPGDLITYTVRMFNAGTDSLANLVLIDPISPWVDVEPGAFGAGLDVRWEPPAGPPAYFTYDPLDTDEGGFSAADRTLRVVFSKNADFRMAPGQAGIVTYRVRVR